MEKLEKTDKLILLFNCYDVWWWINKTDNNPPASGKEFKTKEEAIQNARNRIKEKIIFEEPKPIFDMRGK